ncbi:MAG TPA: helix-turn-helix transcriptional regulator [Polyangium sp.]|nr:helix-turn-helix transcriptional regulator [Polyangium sp.]
MDEAREAFSKLYGEAYLEPLAGVPFYYALKVATYGAIQSSEDEYFGGGQIVVQSVGERYVLSRTMAGTVTGEQAGRDFIGVPGRGYMLFSPELSGTLQIGAGHRARNICIDRGALETHLSLLTGERRRTRLRFELMLNPSQPRTAAVTGLAELLCQEMERPEPSLLSIAALRDALFTAMLTGANHDGNEFLSKPALQVAPACVRRVEEYIVAHAGKPITLEELVAVAGAPARSLQRAFKRFRGTTPVGFLRQVRFDLAHQRLRDAPAHTSIIDVVKEFGLGHAGRFSAEYKQRFGESPSETLARAAGR